MSGAYLVAFLAVAYRMLVGATSDIEGAAHMKIDTNDAPDHGNRGLSGCGPSPIYADRNESRRDDIREPGRASGGQPGTAAHDRAGFRGLSRLPQAGAGPRRGRRRVDLQARLAEPDSAAPPGHARPSGNRRGLLHGERRGRKARRANPKAADGSPVKNLLYAFEGCFDTT